MADLEQAGEVLPERHSTAGPSETTPKLFVNEILHMRLQAPGTILPEELSDDVLAREIAVRSQQVIAHQLALRDLHNEQNRRAQN